MAWRVAKSLNVLLGQLDKRFPDRDRASDGSIGDAVHATRNSDHNPWYGPGIVTARDYTHDPDHGADMVRLAKELEASRDPRIKYLIFNGRIMDTRPGFAPWKWVPYTGTNPHTKHLHLSVVSTALADDPRPWNLPMLKEEDMALEEIEDKLDGYGRRVEIIQEDLLPGYGRRIEVIQEELIPDLRDQLTTMQTALAQIQVAVASLALAVAADQLTPDTTTEG